MIEAYNKTLYYEGDEVEISLKTEIPESFYKYYSLSYYSVKNLIDKKVHFSHPYNLNDIMDGNLQLWDLEEFYQEVTRESKREIDEFAFNKDIVQNKSFEIYKHRGVLCLTNSFGNSLFWPHYTSEQGFCLEFNSSKFLNSFKEENIQTFPITYQPLQKINLSEHINQKKEPGKANIDAKLPILYALSFKDEIWKYENEWRILLTKENLGGISHPLNPINDIDFIEEAENIKNRNIPFNSDSINKIILSNLFFHKNRFNHQAKQNEKEIFFFRKKFTNENDNLFKFLKEIKNHFNDKIYQLDRDFDKEKNRFENKLFFRIKILELDYDKLIIERSLNRS